MMIKSANSKTRQSLESVVSSKHLPSLPTVARKMLDIAQQDEPDFGELCRVIRVDPAVSGKILRTVNSALFAIRPKIESIEVAVTRLGLSTIRTLILGFHLSTWRASSERSKSAFLSAMRNCLTQAVIAELLAEKTGPDPAACFTGGLVQDIGVLAMIAELGEQYASMTLKPFEPKDEREQFGFDHVDVGVQILKRWNMDESFIDAVEAHHAPFTSSAVDRKNLFPSILKLSRMGAGLLRGGQTKSEIDESVHSWLRELNSQLGFNPEEANEILSEIEERVSEYSVIYDFKISEGYSVESIVERANEMLQEIAIESQLRLISIKGKVEEKFDDSIYRDYLTGAYNRRFLTEMLEPRFREWVENKKPAAVFYLDADRFKLINDSHGHAVGDSVIKHIADWLSSCTREHDSVVRMGGDEFLVVMPIKKSTYGTAAKRLANNIRAFEHPECGKIELSLSVGGVHFDPKSDSRDTTLNSLIERADQQMYEAKKAKNEMASTH